MTPDDIRQEIELKVVELIKAKLTDGTMTEERSRQISQLVLDTLKPGMGMEELYKAIFSLDDNSSELSSIVLPYAKQYEFNVTQKTVDVVKNCINIGKYDAAVDLTKRAIKNEVKLEWQGTGKSQTRA